MEAQANTTREQSNKKRLEVGDPRMEQMEEQEKKQLGNSILTFNKELVFLTICAKRFSHLENQELTNPTLHQESKASPKRFLVLRKIKLPKISSKKSPKKEAFILHLKNMLNFFESDSDFNKHNQVVISQWLAWQLATGDVRGSNPSKGDNYQF